MSLEKDITGVKRIIEDDFKGASDEELKKRRKERLSKVVIPVDPEANRIDAEMWGLVNKLKNRLGQLREINGLGMRDECICDQELLDAADEDREYTELPGEYGPEGWCLRCGGYIEINY